MMDELSLLGEHDPESVLQQMAMLEGVRAIRSLNAPMQVFRVLWAYDISVERSPCGEITLVGDLSGLPTVLYGLITHWGKRMAATYQFIERIRDQRDYFAHTDVPREWWSGARRDLVYPGLCFAKVWEWQAIHDVKGVAWVKAHIQMPAAWIAGPVAVRFGQSWLELPGGIIFNGTLQRFYSAEHWYKITQPINLTRRELSGDVAGRALANPRWYCRSWADNFPNVRRREFDELIERATATDSAGGDTYLDDALRWLIPDAA